MLNIICGSIPIDGGSIVVNGTDITKQKDFIRHRRIGRVFQDPSKGTCPSMTILENLSIADNKGKTYGLGRGTNHSRIEHYKEMLAELNLGLEDKLHTKVGALSGGQRQTLALLMATMNPIEFLILDEHTAALDPKTAEIVMQLTGKIVAEKNIINLHSLLIGAGLVDYRLALMHHDKAVSVFNSVAQIVCDHDCCDLLLCHNLACELHYNLSSLWIEGCCVLIKD